MDSEHGAFGRRVRRLREQSGWTQQQLTEKLARFGVKLDTSAITRIENGAREPRLREARLIAQVLNVALDDLVTGASSNLQVKKLWGDLQDAQYGLVDLVYEYGEARRALAHVLDELDAKGIVVDQYEAIRADSRLRAIADWPVIRAQIRSRVISENPPRDESIWDAEA